MIFGSVKGRYISLVRYNEATHLNLMIPINKNDEVHLSGEVWINADLLNELE